MLAETDSFRQGFEIAAQHLKVLREQLELLPDRQGAAQPALEGVAEALQALERAHDDLSRQNQASAARCQGLEAELAYFRDLFENAPHARLLTDLSGAIQVANTPASILFRASQDALTGQQLVTFLSEEAGEALSEHLAELQAGRAVRGWEVRLQPASGDAVDVSLDAVPVRGFERRLVGLQWLVRDISRQVQAEEALRESEDLLRSFVEQSWDGIGLTDEQGRVIEWNRAMEQITGLPAVEAIGRPIWDVQLQLDGAADLSSSARTQFRDRFLALLSSGQAPWLGQLLERTYVRPDGSSRVLQGAVFPFRTRKGFMLGSISRDVTNHRRADEELERLLAQATRDRQRAEDLAHTSQRERDTLQAVTESTRAQVAYLDPDFKFLLVNTAYAEGSRHAKEELIGRNHFDLFPNPENQGIFERVRDTGQPVWYHAKPFEFAGQPERGVTYWDWSLVPVKSSAGQVEGLVLSLVDVTRQVQDGQYIESLRAQAQRQADELGAILNAIPDAVTVWDAQGALLRANPEAAALGVSAHQPERVELAARLGVRHPDGRHVALEELPVARALRGEVVRNETEILVNPAGEEQEILVSAAPVFAGGEIVACVVATHDVTDERRAERERERLLVENRSQREFLERLVEAAPVGIAVLRGPDHRYEVANPYYRAMTGAPDRPIIGRTIVEVIPDLPARGMPAVMDQVYRTGQTVSTREVQLTIGPGREETYWNTDRVPLHAPDGSVEGILVLAHDVTREVQDRRRIEALSLQAQQQAAEMEAVFAALVDPVIVYDAAGAIVRANPAAVESLGLDPLGLPMAVLGQNVQVCYPDGRTIPANDLVAARALGGETVRDESELIVRARGDERAIMTSAAPIVSGDQILGAVAVWHDVTDLRRAQEARRQSEEKLSALFSILPIGLSILDQGRHLCMQNLALSRILSLTEDDLRRGAYQGRRYLRADGTDMPPEEFPSERVFHSHREVRDVEIGVVKEDGERIWISVSAVPLPFSDWRVALATVDITKRKRAEEALRSAQLEVEAEKRDLEAVLQALPVGVIITDAQGGVLLTNGMDEQIWGTRPITHDVDDYAQYKAWWADSGKPVEPHEWASAQAVEKGESVFGQVLEIQRFDGEHRFVLNSAVPIRDAEGRVTGSAVAIQDITELRRAEQALRESEERFRTVVENSRDGINMLDLQTGRYVFMSPAQVKLTGFSAGELRDLSAEEAYDRVHPDDREKSISQQREIAEGREQGSTIEYRWKVKSGEYRWFSDSRTLVRDEQGRVVALVGVSRDITDQKRAEEALRRTEAELALVSRERAVVEERQRLARELHDSVSQALYGISLGVNTALTLLDSDRNKVLEALNYSLSQTQAGLAEMRALIFALRPEALAMEGIVAALGKETAALIARRNIEIELSVCDEPDVSLEVKEALYRIAQEALQNAVKHAQADRLDLRLTCEPPGLRLEVCDNGIGFDPLVDYPGHLGLRSMRERAMSIGGTLDIVSAPNCGTQIRVLVPIPPAQPASSP